MKDRSYCIDSLMNSFHRKSKYINSLQPALSLGKLCFFQVKPLKMLCEFLYPSLLLMRAVIMKALNQSYQTSFKRRSYAVVAGYKLCFIAQNDVFDELLPILMCDFLHIQLHEHIFIENLRKVALKSMSLHGYKLGIIFQELSKLPKEVTVHEIMEVVILSMKEIYFVFYFIYE